MCNGSCGLFQKSIPDDFHYCQQCAKFIGIRYLYREEKIFGRLRCSCCNGLVRNKKRKRPKYFMGMVELSNGEVRPSHVKN